MRSGDGDGMSGEGWVVVHTSWVGVRKDVSTMQREEEGPMVMWGGLDVSAPNPNPERVRRVPPVRDPKVGVAWVRAGAYWNGVGTMRGERVAMSELTVRSRVTFSGVWGGVMHTRVVVEGGEEGSSGQGTPSRRIVLADGVTESKPVPERVREVEPPAEPRSGVRDWRSAW